MRRTRIFEVAQQHGWSLHELARRTGISPSTLCLVRSGKRQLGIRFMERVEAAFPEYARDYLFPRDPKPTNGKVA